MLPVCTICSGSVLLYFDCVPQKDAKLIRLNLNVMIRFHNVIHIKTNSNGSMARNGTLTTKTQIRMQEYSEATSSLFLSDMIESN